MQENHATSENLKQLKEKINDIKVAMLTTVNPDGTLHSRPMYTQEMKDDGHLWFFTGYHSGKTLEIQNDAHVNLAYGNPDDNKFVSVSGTASVVRDKSKIEELWTPNLKAWFPEGKEDPNIGLIKVKITSAEYWDSPSSAVVQLIGMAKAAITGEPYRAGKGENERMNL